MYGFRALRASALPHLPTLIGASAVLLWSPTLGMLRTISEIFGAVGGAALIFTAAAVFSALILGVPRPSQLPRRYLLIGGALFIGTEISLSLSIGLAHHRGQALELVMINYLWPCLTVLLTVLTRMQRGNWLLLPATVLCLLGVVLVITGEGAWSPAMLLANLRSNPLAYALALGASCMWATYSLVTKRIGGSRNAVPLFMIATAAVLWLKYALGDAPPLHLHWGGLAQVAVFALLTATAYSCWNHGLQHGNVTSMAIFSYFAPVLSVLWSSVWLSLHPGMGFVQGVACVTAGSLLCWWATRARPFCRPRCRRPHTRPEPPPGGLPGGARLPFAGSHLRVPAAVLLHRMMCQFHDAATFRVPRCHLLIDTLDRQ